VFNATNGLLGILLFELMVFVLEEPPQAEDNSLKMPLISGLRFSFLANRFETFFLVQKFQTKNELFPTTFSDRS
jgi:hypothetical protein